MISCAQSQMNVNKSSPEFKGKSPDADILPTEHMT